jgi:periplasmic copper chaperone A
MVNRATVEGLIPFNHSPIHTMEIIMLKSVSGALALAVLCLSSAFAHDYKVGDLHIVHPWSRATPPGAKVAGGFMRITNTGQVADRLIGGSAELANAFEVHEMSMKDGVMQMRALEKGLEIKPGETVELKPGGYHVMFLDIKKQFAEGEKVKGFLLFERAGRVEVEFKVEPRGATGGQKDGHQHEHHTHGQKK